MVQLLCTQHWSFLSSISSEVWFAPIAGLGSLASTIAAMAVSPLIGHIGLTGLLWTSSIILLLTAWIADDAYRIAHHHGFEPGGQHGSMSPCGSKANATHSSSILQTAQKLFQRVPTLATLCMEVLVCQCVSSLINFLFVSKVQEFIPNDEERARWTGTVRIA